MASEISTNKTEISIERVKDCLSGKSEDLIKRLLDDSNSTALRAMIGSSVDIYMLNKQGQPQAIVGRPNKSLTVDLIDGQYRINSKDGGMPFQVLDKFGRKLYKGLIQDRIRNIPPELEAKTKDLLNEYSGAPFHTLRRMDVEMLKNRSLVLVIRDNSGKLYIKGAKGCYDYQGTQGFIAKMHYGAKVTNVTNGANFTTSSDGIESELPMVAFMVKWRAIPCHAAFILV